MTQLYLIALGGNMRHARLGSPHRVMEAALEALAIEGVKPIRVSPIIASPPLGPSRRCYANAVALVKTDLSPDALLALLKGLEARFGTRRGQRWGARVLDLDIVLWSEGDFTSPGLTIPHPAYRERDFVLQPGKAIAPRWRDPKTGLSLQQLFHRLTRPRPLPR